MNHKFLLVLVSLVLFATACSGSGAAAASTPEAIPTVIADSTIIAEGRLEPVRYAEIAFHASGVVGELLVREGQSVKQGEPLIRLGDESDTTYAAAQLELVSTQKAINDLQDTAGTDLAQAVIDLREAQKQFDKADNYLTYLQNSKKVPQTETRSFLIQTWKGYEYQYKTKSFKGPAPLDWIIQAEQDLALKRARLEKAQRLYDRLKDGVDADQLAVLEARLRAAEAGLAAFTVTAPFDGIVADLPARLGSSISAGQIAVTVADFSSWLVVTTDLTEIDVVELAEGDPVAIRLDALPEVELTGSVLSIGQTFAESQGDVVYEVTLLLDEAHPALRWGMTASVSFVNED
jgi:multidrug efflux pump subunit AcrA (membrane-fusion protein)